MDSEFSSSPTLLIKLEITAFVEEVELTVNKLVGVEVPIPTLPSLPDHHFRLSGEFLTHCGNISLGIKVYSTQITHMQTPKTKTWMSSFPKIFFRIICTGHCAE